MRTAKWSGVLLVLAFLFSGCASKSTLPRFVWPPPPEEPRLEWKGVYSSPSDIAKSGASKALEGFLGGSNEEQFKSPLGIVSNGAGLVYISDVHQRQVWVYDFVSKKVDFLTRLANFSEPLGLAIDAQNNLYVADGGKGMVFVFNESKVPSFTIENSEVLTKPTYLAVNNELGRLYISDSLRHQIVVFGLDGKYLFSFGEKGGREGQFFAPQGLAFSPDGKLFVTDFYNARVQVFNPDGKFLYTFGTRGNQPGEFEAPKDLAFDSAGNLYVVEGRRSNLEIYSPKGDLLLVLGENRASASPFGFYAPRSVFIDKNDQIYISEMLGRRFVVWQYFGESYRASNPFTETDKQRLFEYMKEVEKKRADM